MSDTDLCQLPPEPAASCCDTPTPPATVPLPINNPPGLPAIRYRIGTFTSFRRAMLDRVAAAGLLGTSPPGPRPFANWHEGADGDYHTVFVELWAYLADILTFYQERIANEAYIGTATQRDSSQRLAQLVNYLPAPGAGAGGLASFSVAPGKVVSVAQGFRVASRAQPGRAAAVYETSSPLVARAEHNAIPLSIVAPTNQFAQLTSFAQVFVEPGLPTIGIAEELYPGVGSTLIRTLPDLKAAPTGIAAFARLLRPRIIYRPFINKVTRSVVLDGVNTRLAVGDYVLAMNVLVRQNGQGGVQPALYQLSSVNVDKASATTTITWLEAEGTSYQQTSGNPVEVYAMRVKASPLGSGAPNWNTLSPTLTMGPPGIPPAVAIQVGASPFTYTNNDGVAEYITFSGGTVTNFTIIRGTQHSAASLVTVLLAPGDGFIITYTAVPVIFKLLTSAVTIPPQSPSTAAPPYANWDDPSDRDGTHAAFVPRNSGVISLDAVYDAVRATSNNPGWIALVPGNGDLTAAEIRRFTQAQTVALTDYAMSSKVTRVTLNDATAPTKDFRIRDTLILTGAEQLTLHNDLPLPDPVEGATLILNGLFPNLQDGHVVVFSGNLFDQSGEAATEVCTVFGPPLQDTDNSLTTVQLKAKLANKYVRSTSVLLANIVAVTHGETVRDEVLGSSDGSALQSYMLKKQPLTYLPSTDHESVSPVQSTLTVTVNGVQWTEQATLFESDPTGQDFIATQNVSGQTTVAFGDGINGARPPTGTNNVHARYRVGLGTSGNVPAAGIQQLLDGLAGLQQATNPQPTLGGADPESLTGIRANAPASLRTFNRAVSTDDYAALARTFPGVAKASARWVLRDANLVALAHPYVQLTIAATDGTPIAQGGFPANLRSYLDQRRDPNVLLRILDFTRIFVDLAVTVDVDNRVPRQATLVRVQAALHPGLNPDGTTGYFAFDNLDFGKSLHLSAIYAFIQNISGVSDANVTRFRRMDQDADNPTMVRTDILIGPTEIAVIGNDPNHPEQGLLSVSLGNGGLVGT